MTLDDPWRRVTEPTDLPAFERPSDLRELDRAVLAAVIRDHLEPRSPDARYNAHWRNFWNVLAFDKPLAAVAASVLDEFIDQADTALDAGDLDPQQRKRAERFIDRCTKALDRVDRAEKEPLAWAGARAAQYNPRSRVVIEKLVMAIAEHRRTRDDAKLWAVLATLRLDPDTRLP